MDETCTDASQLQRITSSQSTNHWLSVLAGVQWLVIFHLTCKKNQIFLSSAGGRSSSFMIYIYCLGHHVGYVSVFTDILWLIMLIRFNVLKHTHLELIVNLDELLQLRGVFFRQNETGAESPEIIRSSDYQIIRLTHNQIIRSDVSPNLIRPVHTGERWTSHYSTDDTQQLVSSYNNTVNMTYSRKYDWILQ